MAACEDLPERLVCDCDYLAGQAPGDVQALGRVAAGDVRDLLGQACGESDEDSEHWVAHGRRACDPRVAPSLDVAWIVLPRLAEVVAQASGDHLVDVYLEVADLVLQSLSYGYANPGHPVEMGRLAPSLQLRPTWAAGAGHVVDPVEAARRERHRPGVVD